MGIDPVVLPLIIPFLWVAGVQLGYLLGQFMKPFTQFGRFACIGFANAAVDFGVFYALVAWVGLTAAAAFHSSRPFHFPSPRFIATTGTKHGRLRRRQRRVVKLNFYHF